MKYKNPNQNLKRWNLTSRMPHFSYHLLIALCCCIFGIVYNLSFWERASSFVNQNGGFSLYVSLFVAFVLIIWLCIEIITFRVYARYMLALLFLICACSAFFMDSLKIGINKSIIESLLNTSFREAKDFLSLKFIVYLIVAAFLPMCILFCIPLRQTSFIQDCKQKALIIPCLIILIGTLYVTQGQKIIFTFKNTGGLMFVLNPIAPIRAAGDYVIDKVILPKSYTHIGLDAHTLAKNKLFVLIIGESARAQNLASYGYNKNTTPFTSKIQNIIYFKNFYSCGVITAISIPCMLTHHTQQTYIHRDLAQYTDNLLDVAQYAGYNVWWVSNNGGGCIGGVCNRLPQSQIVYFNQPKQLDTDMLPQIQDIITHAKPNTFIVINLLGSHGPRYDLKYPKQFEYFTPVCQDETLSNCPQEHIINAYDNSLIHTDFFISEVIAMLEKSHFIDSSLWYVSDHGESLGEFGQYMHGGFPYTIAPQTQKHIPSMIWLKSPFGGRAKNNQSMPYQTNHTKWQKILESKQNHMLSHDYIFSTILSLLEIQTQIYDKDFDILR